MNILEIYSKNSKILLVGPYPPPLGGISVHIKRLGRILTKNGYKVDLFDTNIRFKSKIKRLPKIINLLKLIKAITFTQYDIVHIQYLYKGYILLFFLLKKFNRFKLYYTDHNPRLFENLDKLSLYIKKRFIRNLDYLIVVADHILENYNENNVKLPNHFCVQNAFLPPPIEKDGRIYQSYSHETKILYLSTIR